MTFFLQQLQDVYTVPLISAMLSLVCLNLLLGMGNWSQYNYQYSSFGAGNSYSDSLSGKINKSNHFTVYNKQNQVNFAKLVIITWILIFTDSYIGKKIILTSKSPYGIHRYVIAYTLMLNIRGIFYKLYLLKYRILLVSNHGYYFISPKNNVTTIHT